MVLIDIQVDDAFRDGFVNRGGLVGSESYYLNPSSTYLQIFDTDSTAITNSLNESRAYIVFVGITIPLGAVINNASLSIGFKSNAVEHILTVEALKENDPSTPTSVSDGIKVFTALKADATATTAVPSTQTTFAVQMIDVKDIVQELVRAFTYNNQRMFFTMKTSTKNATNASGYAFENGVGFLRANLIINYSATQTCVPTSDISNAGSWSDTQFGNGDTNLFDELDEGIEFNADDDTTAVKSPADPQPADTFEVKLDPCIDPLLSTDHKIRIRVRGATDVKIQLFEGVTLRAESGVFSPTNSYQTFEYTLSGGEADSITDYSDLRIRVVPQ